jgi:serpin B
MGKRYPVGDRILGTYIMKSRTWLALLGASATLLAACGDGTSPPSGPTEARSSQVRVTSPVLQDGDQLTLVADNGRFAWDLYQAVRATPGNLTFSPASVSFVLAMAYGGARGTTADQMAATLHFSLPAARLHPAFDALDLALEPMGNGHLTLANALWAESRASVLPDYLDLLAENYGAGVHLVDFARDPEAARAAINQWVSDQTNGDIPTLLAPGSIDPLTPLALTNTVYFHAGWESSFDRVDTAGTFQTPGGPVTTAMMSGSMGRGWAGTGCRVAELPYGIIGGASMILVVPDAGTFDAFEGGLTADALEALLAATPTTTALYVSMPQFTVRTALPLAVTLAAMGMPDAFSSDAADFSGIDGARHLFIKDVVHQAVVAVDPMGTTAAASTGAVFARKLDTSGAEMLVVDRPFLFAIRDEATGTILFLGRVVDPTKM